MPQKRPKYRDDEEIDDDQVEEETRAQERQKPSTSKEEALPNQEQDEVQEDNQNQLGAPRGATRCDRRRRPATNESRKAREPNGETRPQDEEQKSENSEKDQVRHHQRPGRITG